MERGVLEQMSDDVQWLAKYKEITSHFADIYLMTTAFNFVDWTVYLVQVENNSNV